MREHLWMLWMLLPAIGISVWMVRGSDFDPDENRRLVHSAAHGWAASMSTPIMGLSCRIYSGGGDCDAKLGDGRIVALDCTLERCRMRRVVQ